MTRPLLGLTFCALTVLSAEAAAQQQAGANSDYRLTMPVLRKALPALYAAGKERCTERQRSPQEIAEMTDNVATVRQNEAELGRLIKEQQP